MGLRPSFFPQSLFFLRLEVHKRVRSGSPDFFPPSPPFNDGESPKLFPFLLCHIPSAPPPESPLAVFIFRLRVDNSIPNGWADFPPPNFSHPPPSNFPPPPPIPHQKHVFLYFLPYVFAFPVTFETSKGSSFLVPPFQAPPPPLSFGAYSYWQSAPLLRWPPPPPPLD